MDALLLVDIQYDFLPGGALAVSRGDDVISVANKIIPFFPLVIASQDWHPRNHGSFATMHAGKKPGDVIELNGLRQVLWPPHCIQGTRGAELAESLDRSAIRRIIRKGMDPNVDSYSAFHDNGRGTSTGLSDYLREQRVRSLYLMGLATDYCVKFTALDARVEGWDTVIIEDGCRGVELRKGDSERALRELENAGVKRIQSASILIGTIPERTR